MSVNYSRHHFNILYMHQKNYMILSLLFSLKHFICEEDDTKLVRETKNTNCARECVKEEGRGE